MSKRITIHDIAREAGVSAATVSYVINDTAGQSISQETKDKIWHVINMFNYKPNVFAKTCAPLQENNRRMHSDGKLCRQSRFYRRSGKAFACLQRKIRPCFHRSAVRKNNQRGRDNRVQRFKGNLLRHRQRELYSADRGQLLRRGQTLFQITPDFEKLRAKADNHFKTDYAFVCPEPNDTALKKQNTFSL